MSGFASCTPCLMNPFGVVPSLGDPLVDEYLRFAAARVRPNTLVAQAFDLKVFFTVVAMARQQVRVDDVLSLSRNNAHHEVVTTWSGWRMGNRGWRRPRSSAVWPRSCPCSTTWSCVPCVS